MHTRTVFGPSGRISSTDARLKRASQGPRVWASTAGLSENRDTYVYNQNNRSAVPISGCRKFFTNVANVLLPYAEPRSTPERLIAAISGFSITAAGVVFGGFGVVGVLWGIIFGFAYLEGISAVKRYSSKPEHISR